MKKRRRAVAARRSDGGFTLVEILVSIVVVGVLSATVVVGIGGLSGKAGGSSCTASADAARTAATAYWTTSGSYPTTIRQLVDARLLQQADGTNLDASGSAITGNGWTLTITSGTPPLFTCVVGTPTTTSTAIGPIITSGPQLTGWINGADQLQLYVYDSGGASCASPGETLRLGLQVQLTPQALAAGATIDWTELGGPSGTFGGATSMAWTDVVEVDGSSPMWFTKEVAGVATPYSTDPATDRFDIGVRTTVTCSDGLGTDRTTQRTYHLELHPGTTPSFDLVLA